MVNVTFEWILLGYIVPTWHLPVCHKDRVEELATDGQDGDSTTQELDIDQMRRT